MSSSSTLSPPSSGRPSFFRSLSSSSAHSLTSSISSRKDKPRLYLALYPRGGSSPTSAYASSMTCDSYHWTLLIGPQSAVREKAGTCHQIIHPTHSSSASTACSTSFYEETDLSQQSQAQSRTLLARITLAKVVDESRLQNLLRSLAPSTLPSPDPSNSSDGEYDTDDSHQSSNCLTWVKTVYKLLTADSAKCLKSYVGPADWPEIEECTRNYIKKKRMQGRFGNNSSPGIAAAHRHWDDNEIATWNFWENRETTA